MANCTVCKPGLILDGKSRPDHATVNLLRHSLPAASLLATPSKKRGRALWSADRPRVIVNFLRIFSNRPLPDFDPRLIGFCSHSDEEVRRWAFKALGMNAHPLVREFAIAKLTPGLGNRLSAALLIRNYAKGDEVRIVEAVPLPKDVNELHGLLMDIIKLLENNDEADPSTLALVAYAHTPCENCRFDAARILHSRKLAPEWMAEECRYDSSEECRRLF